MTRPKVPDDKRRRISQACDVCKRRKQKCDGKTPCGVCERKSVACVYSKNNARRLSNDPSESPTSKRVRLETYQSPTAISASGEGDYGSQSSPDTVESAKSSQRRFSIIEDATSALNAVAEDTSSVSGQNSRHTRDEITPSSASRQLRDEDLEDRSRISTTSGEEEQVFLSTTRMLCGPNGKLQYVGDSATLAYLDLMRSMLKYTSGLESAFTNDPRKAHIVDSVIDLPSHLQVPCSHPDRDIAEILVESYFMNTSGLFQAFDKHWFRHTILDKYYQDPLHANPRDACILFLVFAVGLVLATPPPGSPEEAALTKLSRSLPHDEYAELYFRSAKKHGDPFNSFEDPDIRSVQVLLLMSLYHLSISQRHRAYVILGLAVRSAFGLGLHRKEVFGMFLESPDLQRERCNLFRSIYILDRFLSTSLGRPLAISEDDCSGIVFKYAEDNSGDPLTEKDDYHSKGVDAAVRSCHTIGVILKKIYSPRKVSTSIAQEIVRKCSPWHEQLSQQLHAGTAQVGIDLKSPGHGVAILHVNLLHCHSIILFTRPFFAVLIYMKFTEPERCRQASPRVKKYAELCVSASCHTILMIQRAFEARYMSRRNPFLMYFLFSAAVILLSNQSAQLYPNRIWEDHIHNAYSLMASCAHVDPQGERLCQIIEMFRRQVAEERTKHRGDNESDFSFPQSGLLERQSDPGFDPIPNFFTSHFSNDAANHNRHWQTPSARHGSMPSLTGHASTPDPTQAITLAPILPTNLSNANRADHSHGATALHPPLRSATLPFPVPMQGNEFHEPNLLSAGDPEEFFLITSDGYWEPVSHPLVPPVSAPVNGMASTPAPGPMEHVGPMVGFSMHPTSTSAPGVYSQGAMPPLYSSSGMT